MPATDDRTVIDTARRTDNEQAPAPASSQANVLVVDDSPEIVRMVEVVLLRAGYRVRVASDGEEALEKIRMRAPDLIILDVMMPRMDGFELTRVLRKDPTMSAVSIIILTAKGLSADRLEGLTAGADDYILKPFDVGELLARVRGVLRRTEELKAMSPLTGLPGNVLIEREIERRIEEGAEFAVLYADLDHFKAYNDRYGFARGDDLLRATARVLQDCALEIGGPGSFVGHVGGDDFVLVTDPGPARAIAQAAIARFDRETPDLYDPGDAASGYVEGKDRQGHAVRFPLVSLSIGISTTDRQTFAHYAEAVALATEMKAFTKRTPGSSWAIDSRTPNDKL